MKTIRYFLDRRDDGVHALQRVISTDDALWGEYYTSRGWAYFPTSHHVLLDQVGVEELTEEQAKVVAAEIDVARKKRRRR